MSCRRIIWLTCLCIPSVTLPRTEVASTTIDTCSKTAQDKHVGETVPRTKLSCMYTYKYIYIHRERENEYIYIIIYNSINNIKYYTIYKHTRILFKKVKRNIAEICWIQRSTASTRQMLLMLQTQKVSPLSIAFHQRVTGVWSTPSTSPVMYTKQALISKWFQYMFSPSESFLHSNRSPKLFPPGAPATGGKAPPRGCFLAFLELWVRRVGC